MDTKQAIALWLDIPASKVEEFVLVHRCKPLPVARLVELMDTVLEHHQEDYHERWMSAQNG